MPILYDDTLHRNWRAPVVTVLEIEPKSVSLYEMFANFAKSVFSSETSAQQAGMTVCVAWQLMVPWRPLTFERHETFVRDPSLQGSDFFFGELCTRIRTEPHQE
jgi:hypothetical protein